MQNLTLNARPDERFFVQFNQPVPHTRGWRWLLRRTTWDDGVFTSWVVLWFFQLYHGTAKCDATRTFMLRNGVLGDAQPDGYVMTTTPKEMFALRFRKAGMDAVPVWTNMGGA